MVSLRRSSRMSNGGPLRTQIRDWPAPTTRGNLLERYQPIQPPDEEFSSDLRRLRLHLNDFDHNIVGDVRGEIIISKPVQSGLLWFRWSDSHRWTLCEWSIQSNSSRSSRASVFACKLLILTDLVNRPTSRGNSDDDLESTPRSRRTPGIEDAQAVFDSAVLIGCEGSNNVSPFDHIPHRMVPKVQKAGAYSF